MTPMRQSKTSSKISKSRFRGKNNKKSKTPMKRKIDIDDMLNDDEESNLQQDSYVQQDLEPINERDEDDGSTLHYSSSKPKNFKEKFKNRGISKARVKNKTIINFQKNYYQNKNREEIQMRGNS